MPAILREHGAGIDVIGSFTAILTLPWVFKFLWAPLVDVFRSPRFGFTRWIGFSQLLMCLSLLPLMFIPLAGNIFTWGVLLFIHSLCAATQDVAVDALVINAVVTKEKGMLNGYMQAGMLIARSIFGGGALVVVSSNGLPATIACMIAAIMATMLLLPFIKVPVEMQVLNDRMQKFKSNFKKIFSEKRTWYGIGFALTAAAAFEAAGAFVGPLFTDMQIPQKTIGYFYAIPVVVSMLVGGLLGGFLSDKLSRKKSVAIFLYGVVLMVSVIAILGINGSTVSHTTWLVLFSTMYFFTGMFTAASYALFMDITNPSLGATQFSTYMAATNGCESWVVFTAGFIAASHGYHWAFLAMCGVSLSGLFFVRKLKQVD